MVEHTCELEASLFYIVTGHTAVSEKKTTIAKLSKASRRRKAEKSKRESRAFSIKVQKSQKVWQWVMARSCKALGGGSSKKERQCPKCEGQLLDQYAKKR